ncbi:hypothetical protein OS493_034903 [Desmophyllum pertusum]|uniref:Shavenoid isoform B-like N-terminal domain-containing protein n=1 Tax=Desmophyllum pertusum TaxID=174260 RepID=A0A9W9Z769_9CNID|nr:hypothetical protein OS493_034903 [Desmophyllum pertusum]
MSQRIVNLTLRLFVLAFVLLAESGSGTFNITRYTAGDVFQNTNSSQSCNDSGASCVFDGENSPFCGENCCYCLCKSQTPTYLQRFGNCSSADQLMSILKAQSTIQGCDHRIVVGESHRQCQKEVLTTLNTASPGNNSLYLCPWNQKTVSQALIHFRLAKDLLRCEILPKESFYLFNGSWTIFPRDESALSKLNVEIRPDPAFDRVDKLFLKWTADIERKYDGHIFSLKLRCHRKQGKELNSCVHFKKSGSLTDIKPTLKPSMINTRVPSSSVQRHTATEAAAATSASIGKMSISSTARTLNVGVTSLTDKPQKYSIIVIILAALAAALFVSLTCVAVIFLLWRRKRRFEVRKEVKNASNPVYERGASDTLKMSKITNRSGEGEEECPEYQPLVENTKPIERSDSLPGYRALSVGQRPTNQATNQGVRSSNYLSLIQDDMDEGRDYQTLVKDADPQILQSVNEEQMPDYQELEERTDSEDSFDSSPHPSMDDLDYEEPPVELVIKKSNPPAPRKQQLNNLSSDFHDYDEPEGIIVISDHEDNPHEQAIQDNIDFHDYADPDDTDEDNTNCHVVVKEDAACYHDYADPDYDDPAD